VRVGWQGCCTGGYLRGSWCSGFSLLLAPMQDAELVVAATAQEDRVSARVAAHRVCACSCCLPLHVLASLPPDFLWFHTTYPLAGVLFDLWPRWGARAPFSAEAHLGERLIAVFWTQSTWSITSSPLVALQKNFCMTWIVQNFLLSYVCYFTGNVPKNCIIAPIIAWQGLPNCARLAREYFHFMWLEHNTANVHISPR
jgi:hypothetical protein